MRGRRKALCARLDELGLDALFVTDMRSIRYLTGFTGSSACALLSAGRSWFLTDSRYDTQSREEVKGFRVRIYSKAVDAVKEAVKDLKAKRLGFESDDLRYGSYVKFKKALDGVKLRPVSGLVSRLRQRKDAFEADRIAEAAGVLDAGFNAVLKALRPGVTEKEAALIAETAFREAGGDGVAFDTIIASGYRGALPHGKASEKKMRKGELVVVDMGVLKNGYNSDETRTYCIGRPTALQRKVYGIVEEAQRRAIGKIRPGVKAVEVDRAARGFIEEAGYGKRFGHGLGHGVGLDIHEGPSLSPLSKDVLEEGMVVTVEPGIYLPGDFGVRIEDMVRVVRDGCEVMTGAPRNLTCL